MAIPGQEQFFGPLEYHRSERIFQPQPIRYGRVAALALSNSAEIVTVDDELDDSSSGNEEPKHV